MKSLSPLLLLGVALVLPATLSAKITRTVEKTFAVEAGGSLKASTQGGNITIHAGDTAQVHVVANQVIRASSEKEADEILAALTLRMEQAGGDVVVESKYEKQHPGRWFGSWPPVEVSFVITVPRQYHLNLATSGGNIAVDSLGGNVRARTSGGNMEFARIDGDIDAGTSGGDIRLNEGTARAKLFTSGGNITVERAGGPTEVSTSGGDITLRSVARLLSATTSGGNVRAMITEPLREDTLLSTSGGDVTVEIVKDAGYHLDARTSGGDVNASGLTITLEQGGSGKSKLIGKVNGGGPDLKLRTSGGNIRLRTF